ncbi:MAG: hypothetical protein MPJ05_08145 [Nitrosopumilus sp.]|nr:hypothetical protein [Nitrosopumilus sp.]
MIICSGRCARAGALAAAGYLAGTMGEGAGDIAGRHGVPYYGTPEEAAGEGRACVVDDPGIAGAALRAFGGRVLLEAGAEKTRPPKNGRLYCAHPDRFDPALSAARAEAIRLGGPEIVHVTSPGMARGMAAAAWMLGSDIQSVHAVAGGGGPVALAGCGGRAAVVAQGGILSARIRAGGTEVAAEAGARTVLSGTGRIEVEEGDPLVLEAVAAAEGDARLAGPGDVSAAAGAAGAALLSARGGFPVYLG